MDDARAREMFGGIVLMFHAACMQHLGKTASPVSGKIERDLGQAQITIDILETLSRKTAGNLSEDESKLLTRVLQELKLNYVDETLKDQGSKATP